MRYEVQFMSNAVLARSKPEAKWALLDKQACRAAAWRGISATRAPMAGFG
jgi:hypothetical protein